MTSPTNLGEWLLSGKAQSEAPALIHGPDRVTYAELCARAHHVAAFVRARGAAESVVALCGENSIEYVVTYLGVLLAGAVPALVTPVTESEMRRLFDAAAPSLVFGAPEGLDRLRALTRAEVLPFARTPPGEAATATATERLPSALPEMRLLLFTSGSTGEARGVMLSEENVRANTQAVLRALPIAASDRALVPLPFFYCYGLSVLHAHLRAGACLVLDRSEYPEAIVDLLAKNEITSLSAVPSLLSLLLARSSLERASLPSLRWIQVSGGRFPSEAARALHAALPSTALFLRYGITEVTAAASILPHDAPAAKKRSIGRGLPGLPALCVEATGLPVGSQGADEVGEIVVRGPHVALGYFGADDHGAFRDRAFRTGDLATADGDGFITIVGRARDFVKTAGHRVAPQEVEDVIARMEAVAEVGVFGAPHALRGEALTAVVVPRPGAQLTLRALRLHCSAMLPPFKVPVEFRLAEDLPKGPTGKVKRDALANCGRPL